MIRTEVWEILEDSRATGQILQALNATFITLVPKEGQAHHPKQFRPIALCNVIYKLLTKVIARRLKPILPTIISPEQSGYVEGRQILDSVILAHEVIHSLQKTKTPGMLLKLDLSKAFDKISWEYMRAMLLAFGFDQSWVTWIVNLTSSAFFSLLINGVPSRPFSPSRGIRQGDPLSPFLFIILAEGLSRSIHAAIENNLLTGLPLHGISPPISHSQFVDDTLLMGSPTVREANSILDILQTFSDASGLDCNKDKSQIFFFNTPLPIQRHISGILGFNRSSLPSKYLGIPLIDNALRNSSWEHLLSSFSKRLSSWTYRALNLPSRLTLLQAVLQALPIYSFSALAAPKFVLTTIKSLQRNFIWQGLNTGKKIALVSWDKLCRPKEQGGLGLRDPFIMNKVLSAKIWWRWLKIPKDLWARLWRKKYAPNVAEKNLIRWNEDNPGSLIWTAAKQNRQLVTEHAFWEIRNGKTALFWQDSWQQWPVLGKEEWAPNICTQTTRAGLTRVADYWRDNPQEDTWRQWHLDRESIDLEAHVDLAPWQEEMAKRKIPKIAGEDILRWGYRPQGTFSTREAYQLKAHLDPLPNTKAWRKLWSLKHWPKITLFLWLVTHSSILTWDNLEKRLCWSLYLHTLWRGRGNNEPSSQLLPLHCSNLGSSSAYHAHLRPPEIASWKPLRTGGTKLSTPPSSIVFGNFYRALSFGKPGKKGTEGLFKGLSLPWQHCWHQCYRNILETLPLQPRSDVDLIAIQTNFPSFGSGLHLLPSGSTFFLPCPILPAAPPFGLLPQRTSSSSILMGPLRAIQDLQAME
jgi:hypothetical protein